jgi:hypothetical protein
MNSKTLLLVLTALSLPGGALAARCKFETQEVDHVEAKRVILFRGATVGLGGYFGVNGGRYYLRGLFGSNFRGRVTFSVETPLELTLADNRTLTLDVVTEATSSKMKFGHIITVSRDAEPVYLVTAEQWEALRKTPVVRLHMPFHAKGERQSETRDVKSKHAQKIMDAVECVTETSEVLARPEPAT